MLQISHKIIIPDSEIEISAIRSQGAFLSKRQQGFYCHARF